MRLIDADKLIEEIKQEIDMRYMYSPKGFINVINNQPTAFDVEKVVSELESEKKLYEYEYALQMDYYKGISAGYERALEIVKRGVIDEYDRE